MGEYIDIGGLNTWYEEAGAGEPLVLLHGGMCTNETWGAQTPAFAERFRVVAPERRGHGHTADVDGPLTYADMAADTIGFLDRVVGRHAHLVGWSDGGIVGLMVAISRPDLVTKLVVIGTNYDAAGIAPEAEDTFAKMRPDSPDMAMFRNLYEMHSPDGPEHWPVVFAKFTEMAKREPHIPVVDLARIGAPTLVLVGDDDLISLEHTIALFRAIPRSELAVVPGTSHAVVVEKPEVLNRLVLDFLENDPVTTMLPVRRAAEHAAMN
jgi:pimeloyl-ACP methyl ester carboxylesterase